MPKLQLQFDHNLDFQQEAIKAVVDIFEGLPRHDSAFTLGDGTVPNLPEGETLAEYWLHDNLLSVQEGNNIPPIDEVACDEGMVLEGAGNENWRYPNFTIEMETGTGKTYVYLRTIFELRKAYGFRKFIIVVPSIAIYEGVVKSWEIMLSHFRSLYGNENANLIRYDGSKLNNLRSFAQSSFIQVMVMTMQSFNTAQGRSSNTIYRASEQLPGERKPYEYIQETRPILILDEPQNMGSDLSKEALRTLHPLFALRYSATHKETFNLVYRLTPFEAYQRGLVKRIQVDGVFEQHNLDAGTLILREIKTKPLRAVVQCLAMVNGQTVTREVELKKGDNLYTKTRHPAHRNGYTVTEISAKKSAAFVDFDGQEVLTSHDVFSHSKRAIFQTQIERTIRRHMRVQRELRERGIKVLSLFFIDLVANYVEDDGMIKVLFNEAFEKIKQEFPAFAQLESQDVHRGYFARSKPRKGEEEGDAIDTDGSNAREREAEKDAFQLIMRDKERLLSFDEPVSFIFAHSALKEGWDNPNVFQICTLNQTTSEMKKRQEIGRGLRLPVDQSGERIFDETVNILTVVANQSYDSYASSLQNEYREAGYDKIPPKVTRVDMSSVRRNPTVFNSIHFRAFWEKLCQKTAYTIHVDSQEIIDKSILRFNDNNIRQKLEPQIVVETGGFVITRFQLTLLAVRNQQAQLRIKIETTEDQFFGQELTRAFTRGNSLAKELKDPRFRGYDIVEINENGEFSEVIFANDVKLMVAETHAFERETGQRPNRTVEKAEEQVQPVFNLIDRAANETGLTRRTINQIFKGVRADYKEIFLKNPEGFANAFISVIKEIYADHIVDHLEFHYDTTDFSEEDIDEFFPEVKDFPQKELVDGGDASIYDRVQIDSDVERRFVQNHLSGNDPKVIGYFKFPPTYKINLPRVIGNYNPDWGILRRDDNDKLVMRLVRETKGQEDVEKLRFSNEGRKVHAAQKHFNVLNIDYRVVTDNTPLWHESKEARYIREPGLPYEVGEE